MNNYSTPGINPFVLNGDLSFWVNKILAWFIVLAVLAAVAYIIYAGILLITSSGKEEKYEQAIKTVGYAILGLFIVFSSVAIISFVAQIFGFNFITDLIDFQVVWADIQALGHGLTQTYGGHGFQTYNPNL